MFLQSIASETIVNPTHMAITAAIRKSPAWTNAACALPRVLRTQRLGRIFFGAPVTGPRRVSQDRGRARAPGKPRRAGSARV
jgi:hypothetical protein